MLLSIEPDGSVPIYQQIRDRIVEAIAAGDAPVGTGLPATRQLAVDLGINFHTVNKGYDLLRQEGLLRIGRRAGAVVQRDATSGPPRPDWAEDWAARLQTMLAEATAQGLPAEEIIRHCQDIVAGFLAATNDDPAARRCGMRAAVAVGVRAGAAVRGVHVRRTRGDPADACSSVSVCRPSTREAPVIRRERRTLPVAQRRDRDLRRGRADRLGRP